MFSNMKVALRLAILAGTLVALMLIIGIMGIAGMRAANLGMQTVYNDRVIPLQQLKQVVDGYNQVLVINTQQVLRGIISPLDAQKSGDEELAKVNKVWEAYLATYLIEAEKHEIEQLIPILKNAENVTANLQRLYAGKDLVALGEYVKAEIYPVYNPLRKGFDKLYQIQLDVAAQEYASSTKRYEKTRLTNSLLIAASLAISLVLGLLIARSLLKQLGGEPDYTAAIIAEVASGNLGVQVRLKAGDNSSILHAISQMVFKLSSIISDVRSTATSLSSASEEVSATAQSLSQSATEQAASVEETSASMEEISASISQNNDNARITDSIASQSAKEASEGGEAVKNTVIAMQKIAEKISVIDDIAYQTNLLALNAAIEAGRAGEHGRGFAVVASEVRKLAGRSQAAAKEIGELAGNSVKQAESAGTLLNTIVPSIRKTADLVQEISAASQEQSMGASQITTAISQISTATQQNSTAAEELYSTAEELAHQALQLQEMMEYFKLSSR
jgi:methyl-accepting chemotaxis protein